MPVRNIKLQQHRRIVALVASASTALIALMCTVIGLMAPLLDAAVRSERYSELPIRAATVVKKLTAEQRIACDFVTRSFEGNTDTLRQKALIEAQESTLSEINALFQHYSDVFIGQHTDDLANPSLVFPYAAITEVQAATLKRVQTPGQISVYYQLAKQRMIQLLLGAASRTSAPRHSSSMAAIVTTNLMFAEAAERIALASSLRHTHFTEDSLSQVLEMENLLQYQSAMYLGITKGDAVAADLVLAMQTASRGTVDVLKSLVAFPSVWASYIDGADVTSDAITEALPVVLDAFIERQGSIIDRTYNPTVQYGLGIGLAIGVIGLSLVALFLALRRLGLSTLTREVEAEQTLYIDALGRSYDRIVRFLSSIVRLDVGTMRGAEGKGVQATEREVYALEHHIKGVMRLLHPAIPRWKALGGPAVGVPGLTSPVPREMVAIPTSVLVVDLGMYQIRPTGEAIKSYPGVMCALLQSISSVADSVGGGIIHEVSASRVIVVWNLVTTSVDHEINACQAAMMLHRIHSNDGLSLRFGIATGQVMAGVVGSDSFKPFVVLGKPIATAEHLLRVAMIHNVSTCIDAATFSTLDSQQFLTRPLEVVSMGEIGVPSHGNVTCHELICGHARNDRDGRLIHWNRAFDTFTRGDFDAALVLLKEHKALYGRSKSLQRIAALVLQKRPVSSISDLQDALL